MAEAMQIRAVELVRGIRDDLARELDGKSDADIIVFYRRAGDAARESAQRYQPSNKPLHETAAGEQRSISCSANHSATAECTALKRCVRPRLKPGVMPS